MPQPGDTIKPTGQEQDETELRISRDGEPTSVPAVTPDATVTPVPVPVPEAPEPPQQQTATENRPSWQYTADEAVTNQPQHADIKAVNWTASEFIDHEKNATWFMILAGLAGVSVIVIFLITRDFVTAFVILVAAALFGVTAKRKPRTLEYQLDNRGVVIGGKPYGYDLFKSFAMMEEGAFNSIQLMPLKRFMPPISLYYPPESEDQIMYTLGSFLPHEERTHDAIERLMRRVRF